MSSFSFKPKPGPKEKKPTPVVEAPTEITLADVAIDHPIMSELEEKRKKRIADQSRQDDKIEVNHYVVLVFDSFAQKLEFTEQIKDVNSIYDIHYNGEEFAKKFSIPLTPTGLPVHNEAPSGQWSKLVDDAKIEAAYQRKTAKATKLKLKPKP